MALTYPPYRYQPLVDNGRGDEPYWSHESIHAEYLPSMVLSRSASVQPMQRYLQENDRPLFVSHALQDDPTMHPFPNVPLKYINSDASSYPLPQRYSSPSTSGPSSQFSSTYDDRELTPWSSPSVSAIARSPETIYTDSHMYAVSGYSSYDHEKAHEAGQCIALHDVQHYPDHEPENIPAEDENLTLYGSYAQEGYQPMPEEVHPTVPVVPSQPLPEEHYPSANGHDVAPVYRRRRATSTKSVTSPYLASKVAKRPSLGKRAATFQGSGRGGGTANGTRAFPCPFATYGCPSMFGSKNEWKRHVSTQHIRLGFWRCDQCPNGEQKPNDFNRKDLFVQHVRRMHPITVDVKKSPKSRGNGRGSKSDAEEEALVETARRCYRQLRSAPKKSSCLFCTQHFEGHNSWDERMEHIGRHMEAYKKDEQEIGTPGDWHVDEATEKWLLNEGLIVRQKGHLVLADGKA